MAPQSDTDNEEISWSWWSSFANCGMCTAPRKIMERAKITLRDIEAIDVEGAFERQGLRRWDLLWNSSFAELKGRVLTVHCLRPRDFDTFEEERTLLAHVALSEDYKVQKHSDTDWELRPPVGVKGADELMFRWRAPDPLTAKRWIDSLELACSPQELISDSCDEAKDEVVVDYGLVLSSALTPSMLGHALLDPSSLQVVADIWMQLAEVISGAVIKPNTEQQREAKESLEHAERPFQLSQQQFHAVLLADDDLDVLLFIQACNAFMGVLSLMGSWTVPLAREGYKNCQMMQSVMHEAGVVGPVVSLRTLLRGEHESGMHGADGMINEPSVATGALWASRGLSTWTELLRALVDPEVWEGAPPTSNLLKKSFDHSYSKTVSKYHGVLMQSAVALGTSMLPKWGDVALKFAPSESLAIEDILAWVQVLDKILPRMQAMIQEFDMEDTRKTF